MELTITGLGPGNPDLITISVLKAAKNSDLILMPRSNLNQTGVAEKIILTHIPDLKFYIIFFPMISDSFKRDLIIRKQLENLESENKIFEKSQRIFFPVIGDSSLYSTGAYLYKIFREFVPDLKLRFIPGISAHSAAASCARKFLALGDEIFTIIPATADIKKIKLALEISDSVAIYKLTAMKNIREIINPEIWSQIIRVDYAGLPDEKIFFAEDALENINAYLSVLLLKKCTDF